MINVGSVSVSDWNIKKGLNHAEFVKSLELQNKESAGFFGIIEE
jgi:hypothetical protein